ncbi:iron donor protein CyaY [Thioalkalivibrio denitrificans]|uniref:Iron-sulfur cluster assembly protein CyaY n=1 Tax=Thioalkalivibrio denitrificans TaxID=108003 RepID=A0A1V3NQJ1_9GAMM|nr:iron donor protein CyaY [Thioalkalivibrio denitrificans]OOG27148.1 iron donor protein CyaY [Thioalkalivibrio denitrificans]
MSETSFSLHAEQTLEGLLERMSEIDALADLDMDIIDGVLTLEFDNGGTVILNRQEAASQIWLASPEGPAHFGYDADQDEWLNDRTGETLTDTLNRVLSAGCGEPIGL